MNECRNITNLNFLKGLYFFIEHLFCGLNRDLNIGLIEMSEYPLHICKMKTIWTALQ